MYFHANAEDIGLSYCLLDTIRQTVKVNILAPEYPGYGIYNSINGKNWNVPQSNQSRINNNSTYSNKTNKKKGQKSLSCTSKQIKEDSDCIYDFILENFENIREKDIILYGRSMGSGPTVYLASTRSPGAVILMSSYTSIKNVVYEKFSFFSMFISEQFDNLSLVHKIRSPTLFIHGKKDNLINWKHSEQLNKKCVNCITDILLPEKMTHNEFDFYKDLIRPMLKFFLSIGIDTMGPSKRLPKITLNEIFFSDMDFERYFRRERMKN